MKRKNDSIILKAALTASIAVIIILCYMLVCVQANQVSDVDFQSIAVTAEDMNNLGKQMSSDIMDQVSAQIPSCTPNVFLEYYCKYDPSFKKVISNYFDIE